MGRQAGPGIWIWSAATSEPNIVWEGRQLESEKMICVITYGNVPGAMCRDSVLMAQAYPQPRE
jgi:hypothetical protein